MTYDSSECVCALLGQDCEKHLASQTAAAEQESAMAQLGQWVPAEELASGIGALLAEQGLSPEAKVEQIKAYAAQRGIPITVDSGTHSFLHRQCHVRRPESPGETGSCHRRRWRVHRLVDVVG